MQHSANARAAGLGYCLDVSLGNLWAMALCIGIATSAMSCAGSPADDQMTVVTVATPNPLPPGYDRADAGPRDDLPPLPKGLRGELEMLRKKHAKGMSSEAKPKRHRLRPGKEVKRSLSALPGKCYTILAVAEESVDGLRIELKMNIPPGIPMQMPPLTLAMSEQKAGNSAVLGGAPNCFKNPMPVATPTTVLMRAASGEGNALLQVFVR